MCSSSFAGHRCGAPVPALVETAANLGPAEGKFDVTSLGEDSVAAIASTWRMPLKPVRWLIGRSPCSPAH